ncbi:fibronectin type III domain-containing protein [Eubacterium oxidoreducens]|uniref:Fibronectin type-III domain-containing protein n=1 Tax=Eubacterium oxidoreducens TaxID=1732 RepID=A0A1G6AKK6_EUBOX|nr:fibronectin type III domain-containing protein [Eubacterium oxidoreducens]SDB08915.1 hypothetical protein SAMN02910417_00634 [Eubacterium oxidoreducens]
MKKFKKTLCLLLAAFTMITMGNVNAFADTTNQSEMMENSVLQDEAKGSVRYYGTVNNLKQTKATSNSVTLTWDDSNSASTSWTVEYVIGYNGSTMSSGSTIVTSKTVTISGLVQNSYVAVYVLPNTETSTYNYAYYGYAMTTPSAINKLALVDHFGFSSSSKYKARIGWTVDSDASYLSYGCADGSSNYGYIIQVYNYKGKKIKTYYSTYARTYYELACTKPGTGYKIVVTPYFKSNGITFKGASKTLFAQSQAKDTSSKSGLKKGSFIVKWKKVKNAKSYTVYCAKSSSYVSDTSTLNWKKVKTTKKTSYKVTKVAKKSVNTKKYYYYYKVIVNGKIKGSKKAVKSLGTIGGYVHTY